MSRSWFFLLMLLIAPGPGSSLLAQSTGIPLLSNGNSELALSVQAGVANLMVNDDRHRVFTAVARPAFAVASWMDVYAYLGLVRQNVEFGDPLRADFKGNASVLYGAGVTLQLPWRGPGRSRIYAGTQMAFFAPGGTSYENLNAQNDGLRRIRNTTYEWRQFQSSLFLAYPLNKVEFFMGLELILRNIRTVTTVQLQQEQSVVPVNRTALPYLEQTLVAPSMGFNVRLPHRHQLGVQLRGLGSGDYGLFIGLSQTGTLD